MVGTLVLRGGEPRVEDVEALKMYLETGGIPQKYLDRVLGPQDRAVCVTAQNSWDMEADRRRQELYEKMRNLGPSPRVLEMNKFYNEHGYFRPEDLRWFLGDPMRGVSWDIESLLEGVKKELGGSLLGKVGNN